ncbi:hypothetical protein AX16_000038 [Volvariella volvacea WC 439]|nr:hypothetical protein AX16_000038 [Volvariella volvacea WC 439]
MSSSTINDPEALNALLEQLRNSEAWRRATSQLPAASSPEVAKPSRTGGEEQVPAGLPPASTTSSEALDPLPSPPEATPGPPNESPTAPPIADQSKPQPQSTVASLLSQLQEVSQLSYTPPTHGPLPKSTPVSASQTYGMHPPYELYDVSAPRLELEPSPSHHHASPQHRQGPALTGQTSTRDPRRPPAPSTQAHSPPAASNSSNHDTKPASASTLEQTKTVIQPTTQDVRSLSFQQALPLLASMADDPSFKTLLRQASELPLSSFVLKEEQDNLERKLSEERQGIQKKYEDKVKVAKTKAMMIGTGLSEHERTVEFVSL